MYCIHKSNFNSLCICICTRPPSVLKSLPLSDLIEREREKIHDISVEDDWIPQLDGNASYGNTSNNCLDDNVSFIDHDSDSREIPVITGNRPEKQCKEFRTSTQSHKKE